MAGGSNASGDFLSRGSDAATSREIADVPAVELVAAAALDLISAAVVHLGLAQDLPGHRNLPEARALIDSVSGLLFAAAPHLGYHHAAPLWDGLRTLQLAYREASPTAETPGEGPGERFSGPVYE